MQAVYCRCLHMLAVQQLSDATATITLQVRGVDQGWGAHLSWALMALWKKLSS